MNRRPEHWKHDRDHFYKYMSGSTAKIVLKNRSLKWSPASAFNDPFDMQFDLHLDFDEEKLVAQCKQDFREILFRGRGFEPAIGLGNLLSRLQTITSVMPPAELDQIIDAAIRLAIKAIGPDMTAMHANLAEAFQCLQGALPIREK
jgi:hypothetical protein